MKVRIQPYKVGSRAAKELSLAAGVLRTTPRQVRKHGSFDVIINWGSTERRFANARYINAPEAVALASDKRRAFERFRDGGVPCPDFTTSKSEAENWLRDGVDILCRSLTRGYGGRGITLIRSNEAADRSDDEQCTEAAGDESVSGSSEELLSERIPECPLYVKYVPKRHEYRVHVVRGVVLDVQHKRKRREVDNDDVNYQIRSASNGWVFCRGGVEAPDPVVNAAVAAVRALDLDFGAVDVGWNEHYGTASVYEVNTAPGLEGTTVAKYFDAIAELIPQVNGGRWRVRRQEYQQRQ